MVVKVSDIPDKAIGGSIGIPLDEKSNFQSVSFSLIK